MRNSNHLDSNTKKAIVSACLLGHYCRYDGKTKKNETVVEKLGGYEIIPFCPEAPVFGTPRERINVVQINGEKRIITDETGIDVTHRLRNEIDRFTEANPCADRIVLKSKSPSCGLKTTPILDQEKNITEYGNGLAADIFVNFYKDTKITDENFF